MHRRLGCGFLESVYEKALAVELSTARIQFVRQAPLEVWYQGYLVGNFTVDFIIERQLLLELKAQKALTSTADAQLLNYLKATELNVGLLLNFGTTKIQLRRLVRNLAGDKLI